MADKKELNALNEEELEKVSGGKMTVGGEPKDPGNTNYEPRMRPAFCEHFIAKTDDDYRCMAPMSARTKDICKNCPAEGIFSCR